MIAIQPKTRQLLGVNQQAYQALKSSMSLNLRRQLLIAVCDDVRMQNHLAAQLETDLAEGLDATLQAATYSSALNATSTEEASTDAAANALRVERLIFDPEDGNLPQQVAQWVRQTMLSERTLPKVQVLGIEQMIHQPAITQNYFLRSLEKIEALLPRLNTSLLVWVPWPWLRTIQQSSPTFWNWRNGVFEFVSEPTPTPESPGAVRLEFPLFNEADIQPIKPKELPESEQHNNLQNGALAEANLPAQSEALPDRTEDPEVNSVVKSVAVKTAASPLPVAEKPVEEKPVTEKPVAEKPVEEVPVIEEPVAEEPVVEEPVAEEATTAMPPAETFVTQLPTTADVAQAQAVARALITGKTQSARSLVSTRQAVPISHSLPTRTSTQTASEQLAAIKQADPPPQAAVSSRANEQRGQGAIATDRVISSKRVLSMGGLSSVVSRVVTPTEAEQAADPDTLAALDALAQDSAVANEIASEIGGEVANQAVDKASSDVANEVSREADLEAPESVDPQATDNVLSGTPETEDLVADALIENDAAATAIAEREFASLDWDDFIDSSDVATLPELDESLEETLPELDESLEDEIAADEIAADEIDSPITAVDATLADTDVAEAVIDPQAEQVRLLEAQTKAEAEQRNQAAEYFALGLSYRGQIEAGERGLSVIEPAIAAYESGLDLMAKPHADWVTGLNDLGTLYWLKAQQQSDPTEAIAAMKQSIRLYKEALAKSQSGDAGYADLQPGIIGQLYSNMGAVYTVLATYDEPEQYLKQAADTYTSVLALVPLQEQPTEYATLQNSLGSVYWKLSHYDAAPANLHRAIGAYNEALLGYKPEQKPLEYAAVQNNLGITYWSLAKHERSEFLLKHAIAAYRDALNYRTSEVDPAGCAISYNNLALAYWDLSKQTNSDIAQKSRYQKNAVTAFEAALNISKLSGALNSMDSAAIYHCLGDVHAQMIETAPSTADIAESLQKSLYSYIQSIEGLANDDPAYAGRFAAIIANLKLHYEKVGLEGQQNALNRIPPTLLPQVMMAL